MNFKPLGERVVVQPHSTEEVTPGGIHIPHGSQERPNQGVVVAVSDEVENIEVGNEVLFEQYSGVLIKIDGKEYAVVQLQYVMGIFQ